MADEDELTKLTDDCLLDVLGRLDYNDLDECELLNGRFGRLSKFTRPNARKIEAQLKISKKKPETEGVAYWVDLAFDNQNYYLDIHGKSRIDAKMKNARSSEWDFDTPDLRDPSDPDTWTAPTLVSYLFTRLLARFEFSQCEIRLACIFYEALETNDLLLVELVGASSNQAEINLSVARNELDAGSSERFLNILLSAKPIKMALKMPPKSDGAPFVDESFIKRYADAVHLPGLAVLPHGDFDTPPLEPADQRSFAAVWSRYGSLDMPHMIVHSEFVLGPLLERLRCCTPGRFLFRISSDLEAAHIEAAADAAGMEYWESVGNQMVGFTHTIPGQGRKRKQETMVVSVQPDGELWTLEATFS